MSKRVRTGNVEAQIRARSRAGLSNRAIAAEMGLSRQTVDRALASKPAAAEVRATVARQDAGPAVAHKPKSTPPVAPAPAAANLDELRLLMAELARGLTARRAQPLGPTTLAPTPRWRARRSRR